MLKEFHESPEGEVFLVSVNLTEHQRRNVLNNKGFTKSPGEIHEGKSVLAVFSL